MMSEQSFKELLERVRTTFDNAAKSDREGKNTEACEGYRQYLNLLDELSGKDEYQSYKGHYDEYVMPESRSETEDRIQYFDSLRPISDRLTEQLQKLNQGEFQDDPDMVDQDSLDDEDTADFLPPPTEDVSGRKDPVNTDANSGACTNSAGIPGQQNSGMFTRSFHCKAVAKMDEIQTKAYGVGSKNNCDVLCTSSHVMTKQPTVKLLFANIEATKVDAIVTSTNEKLRLKVGNGLSAKIQKAAGVGVQEELRRNYPNGLQPGGVAKSGAGDISTCKAIYYVVLPMSRKDKLNTDECYNALVQTVLNVLVMASSDGYTSVAFPALGTGNIGYPTQEVVQLMFQAVFQFFNCVVSPIQEVFFVIYPKADVFVKQLFLMEHFSYQFNTRKVDCVRQIDKELKNDPTKMCEARFKIGTTFLQIGNGDVRSCFHGSNVVLILWTEYYLDKPEENPVMSCIDSSAQENIYACYLPNLRKKYTKVAEDKTPFTHARLIHLHCTEDTDDGIAKAIARGIKHIKEDVTTITIPILSDGSRYCQPHIAANAILKALQKVSNLHHVVQVILQERVAMEAFLQSVLDHPYDVHVEPNVTKAFDTIFPLRERQVPIGDVTITVTPRSGDVTDGDTEVSVDKAAMELKRELGITLMYGMTDQRGKE